MIAFNLEICTDTTGNTDGLNCDSNTQTAVVSLFVYLSLSIVRETV